MRNTNSKRPTAKPLKKSPSTTATETKKSVVVPEKKVNAPIEEKSTVKAKTLKSSENTPKKLLPKKESGIIGADFDSYNLEPMKFYKDKTEAQLLAKLSELDKRK